MITSVADVLDAAKVPFDKAIKDDTDGWQKALASALDDYSMRLEPDRLASSSTVSVTAGNDSVFIDDPENAMQNLSFLVFTSGGLRYLPTYLPAEMFMARFPNDPRETGIPTHYTILDGGDTAPTITFSHKLQETITLTFYYFAEVNEQRLYQLRILSPLVVGTQAYFLGIGSKGAGYYAQFEKLVVQARAKDGYRSNTPIEMQMSRDDRDIRMMMKHVSRRRG